MHAKTYDGLNKAKGKYVSASRTKAENQVGTYIANAPWLSGWPNHAYRMLITRDAREKD